MKAIRPGYKLPDALKIGERFLLSFDGANASPQPGRLQDMSKDGALCIDVAPECQPPRGTLVTVSSIQQSPTDFHFLSEILGRRKLDGRVPVLLLKAPSRVERQQRRDAFRISAALKASVAWEEDETLRKPAVLTNLSGGGGRFYMRWLPQTEHLMLSISAPDAFIKEWAMRQVGRMGNRNSRIFSDSFKEACDKLHDSFEEMESRLVKSNIHSEDDRGPIYALAASFTQPSEGAYRLVRYLERQAAQRGVQDLSPSMATAA